MPRTLTAQCHVLEVEHGSQDSLYVCGRLYVCGLPVDEVTYGDDDWCDFCLGYWLTEPAVRAAEAEAGSRGGPDV